MTIRELQEDLQSSLAARYGSAEATSISRIVVEDAFDFRNRSADRPLLNDEQQLYRHIRFRLLRGEPVQYILGEADFYGLKFRVDPRVLIPRQETEELVHWVLETWKKAGRPTGLKVLDIGTGSGCIPVSLKKEAPELELSGLDVREEILALAAENALANQVEIHWLHTNILDTDSWDELGTFDYIISNPPYIPPSQRQLMPEHVLSYEPELALFVPEHDPLVFYREIGLFAYRQLHPGGALFFEINEFNAERLCDLMRDIGFEEITLRQDLSERDRLLCVRK